MILLKVLHRELHHLRLDERWWRWLNFDGSYNRSIVITESLPCIGILCEVHLRCIVVTALLFVVAASYIVGKAYLLIGVYVACETTFAVAVGADVPRADTLVWF